MLRHLVKIYITLLCLSTQVLFGQSIQDLKSVHPKRLIDKIETFAGPSLCLNHGNKFVENYEDENITNERQLKIGYMVGIGGYHQLRERWDLNIRLQYEKKGTKNELNTPLSDGSRVIYNSEYDYHYFSLTTTPHYLVGKKRKLNIGLGGYISLIKRVDGNDKVHVLKDSYVEKNNFEGRKFQDVAAGGTVYSASWSPGLTGIEKYDYGITLSIGYVITVASNQSISICFIDNFGLQNINKDNPYDLVEKNHT